ncbi:MAG TPA: hypothetical protein VGO63_00080 [Candidatus Paceibacterota bacterium]|jgi:hypothetical protein|nr:hypothetical protein [Candidatus Paceibacterota bacterium]
MSLENMQDNIYSLSSMELKAPVRATAQRPEIENNETLKVVFNGVELNLNIESKTWHDNPYVPLVLLVIMRLSNNQMQEVANISMSLEEDKTGKYIARVEVQKMDYSTPELKGLGLTLWERIPKFMQSIANDWKISLVHCVKKAPTSGLNS